MRNWLIVAAVALISAAPAPSKFDLECSGTTNSEDGSKASYTERYRLNLGTRRWCMGECRVVKPIADLQNSMILLEQSTPPDDSFKHFLDREKGQDLIFDHGPPMSNTTGECKRLPFSGFPSFKTKF
jgi:hypothetical protein